MYLNSGGKVLKFLMEHDGSTILEISRGAGVAANAVQYVLQGLEIARDATTKIARSDMPGRSAARWTLVPEAKERVGSWFVFLDQIARGEHPPVTVKP
jgi:hypothetical protein